MEGSEVVGAEGAGCSVFEVGLRDLRSLADGAVSEPVFRAIASETLPLVVE